VAARRAARKAVRLNPVAVRKVVRRVVRGWSLDRGDVWSSLELGLEGTEL